MNKISMLSIALSLLTGFALAEEAKEGAAAPASETPVADTAQGAADAAGEAVEKAGDAAVEAGKEVAEGAKDAVTPEATPAPEATTPAPTPKAKPMQRAKKARKSGATAASKKATEALNKDVLSGKNDEAVREEVEAKSDKERELAQKKETLEDTVSDKMVAEADAKKDNHLHQHSDLYAKKQEENAKAATADAKDELAKTEQELKEVQADKAAPAA